MKWIQSACVIGALLCLSQWTYALNNHEQAARFPAQASTGNPPKRPTLVLVHGALLTGSIWGSVQSHLQNHLYNVVTLDVPGRGDDDVASTDATLYLAAKKVCDVANMQEGQVVLAGHSQSGAVINQAIHYCAVKIKALIYIAAVVPFDNEKPYDLLSEEDGLNFDRCAKQDISTGYYQIDKDGPLKEMFMDDASEESAKRAIANMVPEPIIIGDNTLHFSMEIFRKIPKFYIKTTSDKIISLETQNKFISRLNFIQTHEVKSSHSPFISKPKQLSDILMHIVDIIDIKR